MVENSIFDFGSQEKKRPKFLNWNIKKIYNTVSELPLGNGYDKVQYLQVNSDLCQFHFYVPLVKLHSILCMVGYVANTTYIWIWSFKSD